MKNSMIAETLDKMQAEKNSGRGVSCIRTVILYLLMEDREKAIAVCRNESDKIRNYNDIRIFICKHLVDLEH